MFAVQLTDGTLNRYLDETPTGNLQWLPTFGFTYTGSGTNTNEWHDVEMESSLFPFSGIVYVYLTEFTAGSSTETHFKDMRFEYVTLINESTKIIGHTHKQEQDVNKKNTLDEVLFIDDSPRNAIKGSLYLTSKTGVLQDLTAIWRYPPDASGWRLGERSTLQELTWRQKTRQQYEGGFTGLWQNSVPASMLTMIRFSWELSKNYIFGMLTIDYKRNQFSGTLWEISDDNDELFEPDYEFKYLYSTT